MARRGRLGRRGRRPPGQRHRPQRPAGDPGPAYISFHRVRIGRMSCYAQAAEAESAVRKRRTRGPARLVRVFTVTDGGRECYVQMTALRRVAGSLPVIGVFFATFRPLVRHLPPAGVTASRSVRPAMGLFLNGD